MEDHEIRLKNHSRMDALLQDKRQTEEQVAAFAKKAVQQNEFHRSRAIRIRNFGATLSRRSRDGCCRARRNSGVRHNVQCCAEEEVGLHSTWSVRMRWRAPLQRRGPTQVRCVPLRSEPPSLELRRDKLTARGDKPWSSATRRRLAMFAVLGVFGAAGARGPHAVLLERLARRSSYQRGFLFSNRYPAWPASRHRRGSSTKK